MDGSGFDGRRNGFYRSNITRHDHTQHAITSALPKRLKEPKPESIMICKKRPTIDTME